MRTYRVVWLPRTIHRASNCASILCVTLTVFGAAALAADGNSLEERCEAEVIELHEWIETWSNADLRKTEDAFARFSEVIAPTFLIVDPDGSTAAREPIIEALRNAHGRWRDAPLDITIRNFRFLYSLGDFGLAMYEEWHESRPQDETKVKIGRLSTVLFGPSPDAPNGLEWLHLHESWVPGYEPAAE